MNVPGPALQPGHERPGATRWAHRPPSALLLLALLLLALPAGGCRPLAANIELRRQNQELRQTIAELQRTRDAQRARLRAIEQQVETVPTLPQQRLDRIFTTHGLRFGRLTGGVDMDPDRPGDDALRIQIVPIDQMGQPLKAAGAFIVEAFDLSRARAPLIGRWQFGLEQAKENWIGQGLVYHYVLVCPWQRVVPEHDELTVRVTFRDELTGRVFTDQRIVTVNPPMPAGSPAPAAAAP